MVNSSFWLVCKITDTLSAVMENHQGVGFTRFLAATAIFGACLGANAEEAVITPSIIGGVISPAGDYPWMGALVSLDEESLTDAQFCGCTLIDEAWILTAAHCLDGSRAGEIAVAFGDGNLEGDNVVVPIDLIVMHPDYFDVLGLDNDLALARLVRPVDTIEPLALNTDATLVADGQPIRVMGWGLTDVVQNEPGRVSELRQADLSVLDRDWINSEDVLDGGVSERSLPIGSLDPLVTSSFGDSGGPMIVSDGNEERLAGVASWGTGCFTSVLPYSIYTDVLPYLDWIDRVINRDRWLWEQAHGVDLPGNEDAYRLARSPDAIRRPMLFADREGIQTSLLTRPFSPDWTYSISYFDIDDKRWREIEWDFAQGLTEDGSAELTLPHEAMKETILIRSDQATRNVSRAAMVELPLNQLVSSRFGERSDPPTEDARAFRIAGLEPNRDYRIHLSSNGGPIRYHLRSNSKETGSDHSGEVNGRADLAFTAQPGSVHWLYLVPVEDEVECSVYLSQEDNFHLSAHSSDIQGGLEQGDARLGADGYYVDSFSVYGNTGGFDALAIVEGSFDPAIAILDTKTLKLAGQSNAWEEGYPEYLIYNRSSLDHTGVDGMSLRVVNAIPEQIGHYRLQLLVFEEFRELSLADEYDFRGLTVRDHTANDFNGHEYVDRLELTGLGSGKRFVKFTGFESFRPTFAVRNITDDVVVQKFARAFCYESSVIEFEAVPGKRYEAIVAAGEADLNKNYFLELSTTKPASPYEEFSTVASEGDKMKKWMQRMKLDASQAR